MYLSLLLGVILISLALCADGAIGNVQEKAMKQHEASNTEIVRKIVFPRKRVLQTFESRFSATGMHNYIFIITGLLFIWNRIFLHFDWPITLRKFLSCL